MNTRISYKKTKKHLFWTIVFVLPLFIYTACHTVAVSGRKQVLLFPASKMNSMSFQQYDQFLEQNKISRNAAQTKMVKDCGRKIKTAVEKYMKQEGKSEQIKDFQWEFNLVDDPTVNAWCMPGGKVVFYTGIMPICKDETGVAVVMGHEVAHAIANHGGERMSHQAILNGILTAGSFAASMKEQPSLTDGLMLQAVGAGSQLGMLAFSRKHESEADYLGIIFMAMAGYKPNAAPEFWKRMSANSGGQAPPEFMSTHPSHDRRISDLSKWIPEAMGYYQKASN